MPSWLPGMVKNSKQIAAWYYYQSFFTCLNAQSEIQMFNLFYKRGMRSSISNRSVCLSRNLILCNRIANFFFVSVHSTYKLNCILLHIGMKANCWFRIVDPRICKYFSLNYKSLGVQIHIPYLRWRKKHNYVIIFL